MKKSIWKKLSLLTVFLLLFSFLFACAPAEPGSTDTAAEPDISQSAPDPDGSYTSAEDVSAYLLTYGRLPQNFITKKEARDLGWEGGSLEPYAPGMCIGGDKFGNYEGNLPEKDGRTYYECDINTLGADRRGAERIVFSDDGLIYYTADHYETFTLLYGEE
ncbi:MAG: ribonuclease domain-containing protein [Anaerovoracaceae bacterium]